MTIADEENPLESAASYFAPDLVIVPEVDAEASSTLTPYMVALAREGARMKAQEAEAKRRLKTLDLIFEKHFVDTRTRIGTNAAGEVVVQLNHGEQTRLDQPSLKEKHPAIVRKFTWPHPYDTVHFVSP